MRNVLWRRLGAGVLALLLCTLGTGSALAGIMDVSPFLNGWLEEEGKLHFSLSLEVNALLPFTSGQTEMMNQLLKHIFVWAAIEQDQKDSVTTMAMASGAETAGTFVQRVTAENSTLETSFLPNRVLKSEGADVADILFPADSGDTQNSQKPFDLALAISEAEASYRALVDACTPWMVKKKANFRIKDVGAAKWSEIAKLTPEQSEEVLPKILAVLQSGMDMEHRQELGMIHCGKGFTVGLYKEEENGKDMAVYMKGTLIYPDQSTATLVYQWSFAEGKQRMNTYKYELVKKGKGGMSRKVTGSLAQGISQSEISVKGISIVTEKRGITTTVMTGEIDLSGQLGNTTRTLKGTVSDTLKTTENKKSETLVERTIPNLMLTEKEGSMAMSGSVRVEKEKNKVLTSALTLQLDGKVPESFLAEAETQSLYRVTDAEGQVAAEVGEEIFQRADMIPVRGSGYQVGSPPIGLTRYFPPANKQVITVSRLSESDMQALRDEIVQRFSGSLLGLLVKLPEKDLALLKDGMTNEDYQRFLSLLGNL